MRRTLFIAVLTFVFAPVVARATTPLTGSMEAHKVVRGDAGREVFVSAAEAVPQDVIEYRLKYANNSTDTVRNVSVVDPIPAGTQYVALTATRPNTGAVEFSIDNGKSYSAWPVRCFKKVADGRQEWVEATPDMVTHIRWIIEGELVPETEITFSYRTTVK